MKVLFYLCAILPLVFSCNWSSEQPLQSKQILDGYHITAIDFDKAGNAWLGTLDQGLIKFDGQNIKVYPEITKMIRVLKVDSKNQVFLATDGLVKFDGENFIRYDPSNTPGMEGVVMDLDIDSKDQVWFAMGGFNSGGLGRLDEESFTFYTPDNSPLTAHWVSGIKVTRKDEVWVSSQTSVGNVELAKIKEEEWSLYNTDNLGFNPYSITNLEENSRGDLVAGIDYSLSSSNTSGRPPLFTFDEKVGKQINANKSFQISKILVDSFDRIWCAGYTGYAIYMHESWSYDEETFKDISVFSISQAPNGEIWMGTGDGVYVIE